MGIVFRLFRPVGVTNAAAWRTRLRTVMAPSDVKNVRGRSWCPDGCPGDEGPGAQRTTCTRDHGGMSQYD